MGSQSNTHTNTHANTYTNSLTNTHTSSQTHSQIHTQIRSRGNQDAITLPHQQGLPSLPSQHLEPLASLGSSEVVGASTSETQLDEPSFKQMIRAMNLKVTEQRMDILQSLYQGYAHVTVQDLYERVSKKNNGIGFATVYRFLKMLTAHGFVTELRVGGQPSRYELTPQAHHDHLTCIRCGKICEFENNTIEEIQIRVAQQFGFRLTGHVLELYGVCPDCQLKEIPSPALPDSQ